MQIKTHQIDTESFMVHEHMIGSERVYLIQPQHVGCKWSQENSIFRSLVIDTKGNIVSASWKKFVNWGEKPEHFPVPKDITKCELVNKEDGSSLICSMYMGNLIMRTRGTVDASKINNGHEIAFFQQKYPQIKTLLEKYDDHGESCSIIFEWLSPENIIVLKVTEPELILTGVIFHKDYSYMTQKDLDLFASKNGFKRPVRYSFDNFADLLEKVPNMKGIEGICVYHDDDQQISKLKTDQYKKLHFFKSNISEESLIELYAANEFNTDDELLLSCLDFECFTYAKPYIETVKRYINISENVIRQLNLEIFDENFQILTKKQQAEYIISNYDNKTNQLAFCILNKKDISKSKKSYILKMIN